MSARATSFSGAVAATYLTNVFVAFLSLANVVLTSRALGPEGRGTIAFLTTIAMLTSQLSSLGIEEASANVTASRPDLRRAVAGNAAAFAAVLGSLAALLVAALMLRFPGTAGGADAALRWLTLASVPLLVFQFYLQFIIRAHYGFAVTNAAALVGPVLNVVVNTALYATGVITVETAVITWLIGQVLATSLLAAYVGRALGGYARPRADLAAESARFGAQAHVGRMMKTGNYRLDQWLLGALVGERELGLYSVAVAWTEALFFLPEAIALVLRPDVVRSQRADAGRRTAAAFRVAVVLTLPLVVVFLIAAPLLCVGFFGGAFTGSIDDLRVLALGAFGMVAMKVFSNSLVAQGRPMLGNAAIAVAFACTIVLDLLLIPAHGGLGAAIASSVAYTAGGAMVAIVFARALQIRLRDLAPARGDVTVVAAPLAARLRPRWLG